MKQGQVSIEAIFAIGMMLLMFTIVITISYLKRQDAIKLEEYIETRAECLRLADALSSVLTLGPDSNITLSLYYKHSVANSSIIYSYANASTQHVTFCNYLGRVGPYTNLSGTMTIANTAGNVSVEK